MQRELVKSSLFAHHRGMNCRYFDWAATSPMSEASRTAYLETAERFFGNPSSIHSIGKRASARLAEIRESTARLIGVEPSQITFTSGGTESNALVCNHFLKKKSSTHIIVSGIEHPSVYEYITAFKEAGHEISIIDAPGGHLSLKKLKKSINERTSLILVMSVNNVLGTIQDLKGIRSLIEESGRDIHVHTDAVQAFGKIGFDYYLPYVDSFSASAHKIEGPKGCGLLYSRRPLISLSQGGGQEGGLRPGTEDLPALVAFHAAMMETIPLMEEHLEYVGALRDRMSERLRTEETGFQVLGSGSTSPYILALSTAGIPSEVFVRIMNDQGFCISTGSACSSKSRRKTERVLRKSHFTLQQCASAIRISLSRHLSEQTIDALCDTMIQQSKLLGARLGR